MDQEKIGKFIKEIRKKNNLTQKQLADKYNVTYQAVSKWENGKNMPDTSLIKQMSQDFNISLEEFFAGEYKEPKTNKKKIKLSIIIISIIALIIISLLILIAIRPKDEFQFKILTSNSEEFKVSGNISYSKNESAIYITDIEYQKEDDLEYNYIECNLYEKEDDLEKKVANHTYSEENNSITLKDFLKEITFTVDYYDNICQEYDEDNLYITIIAKTNNGETKNYKIPLSLESCSN